MSEKKKEILITEANVLDIYKRLVAQEEIDEETKANVIKGSMN